MGGKERELGAVGTTLHPHHAVPSSRSGHQAGPGELRYPEVVARGEGTEGPPNGPAHLLILTVLWPISMWSRVHRHPLYTYLHSLYTRFCLHLCRPVSSLPIYIRFCLHPILIKPHLSLI